MLGQAVEEEPEAAALAAKWDSGHDEGGAADDEEDEQVGAQGTRGGSAAAGCSQPLSRHAAAGTQRHAARVCGSGPCAAALLGPCVFRCQGRTPTP